MYYAHTLYKSGDIKVLEINGVCPTPENLRGGKYPFATCYYAVYRQGDEAAAFAEWLQSDAGKNVSGKRGIFLISNDFFLDTPPFPVICSSKFTHGEGCAMENGISQVRQYYDENAVREWTRLEEHPFEFLLTVYMLEKYIRPGDRVLDIGGGPGRYAIHLAKMGCRVALVDLSESNIALAREKAAEAGVTLETRVSNCLELDALPLGEYDHVLLMGPLYHLLDEVDRIRTVELALDRLKPGGLFYASFILLFAGVIYDLKNGGFIVHDSADPFLSRLLSALETGDNYTGPAFTSACFYHQNQILPFMERFPLKKLHLFGQEGILAPNEREILARDQTEVDCWLTLAKRFLELPELLAYSEHAMYIGKKLE